MPPDHITKGSQFEVNLLREDLEGLEIQYMALGLLAEYFTLPPTTLQNLPRPAPWEATNYCKGTWLHLSKRKIVAFQVKQNYRFGVIIISLIEGCHIVLKSYL